MLTSSLPEYKNTQHNVMSFLIFSFLHGEKWRRGQHNHTKYNLQEKSATAQRNLIKGHDAIFHTVLLEIKNKHRLK
jgi:hypothetical protein